MKTQTSLKLLLAVVLALLSVGCKKTTPKIEEGPGAMNEVALPAEGEELPTIRNYSPQPFLESDRPLVEAGNAFNYKLFSRLLASHPEGQQMILSPMSLELALSAYGLAISDKGFEALKQAFHYDVESPEALAAYYQRLTNVLCTSDTLQRIFPANGVWINQSLRGIYKPLFGENLAKYFDAVVAMEYLDRPEGIERINYWIGRKSYGKITRMLDPASDASDQLLMVLANVLYFNSPWNIPFNGESEPGVFYSASDQAQQVDMMAQQESYPYAENDAMQMVRLPLSSHAYSLDLVLPKGNAVSLDPSLLTSYNVPALLDKAEIYAVTLTLPKLKAAAPRLDLTLLLEDLGLSPVLRAELDRVFNLTEASPILRGRATVLQKSLVNWDEKGVEAVAATVIMPKSPGVDPSSPKATFLVNRPFFFILSHNESGKVLFVGAIKSIR